MGIQEPSNLENNIAHDIMTRAVDGLRGEVIDLMKKPLVDPEKSYAQVITTMKQVTSYLDSFEKEGRFDKEQVTVFTEDINEIMLMLLSYFRLDPSQLNNDRLMTNPVVRDNPEIFGGVLASKIKSNLIHGLELTAYNDPLTGLLNRRSAAPYLERFLFAAKHEMLNRIGREDVEVNDKKGVAFLVIDADKFSDVNNTYGHSVGDDVLISMSHAFREAVREEDVVVRWGGEEFLIALPKVTKDEAIMIADRIQRLVAKKSVEQVSELEGKPQTLSIGVAHYTYEQGSKTIDDLVKRADGGVYGSKETGRNQVVFVDSEGVASSVTVEDGEIKSKVIGDVDAGEGGSFSLLEQS